jgi:hypothetical protein
LEDTPFVRVQLRTAESKDAQSILRQLFNLFQEEIEAEASGQLKVALAALQNEQRGLERQLNVIRDRIRRLQLKLQ